MSRARWCAWLAAAAAATACGGGAPQAAGTVDVSDNRTADAVDAGPDVGALDAVPDAAPDAAASDADPADAGPDAPLLCYFAADAGPDAASDAAAAEDVVPAASVDAGSDDVAGCPPGEPLLDWPTPDRRPPAPATLQVELGTSDGKTGAFVPYVDGQWAPIVHGVQGGIHVWAAVRTTMPGSKLPKFVVEVAGHSFLDCKLVATELTASTTVFADGSKPGTWSSASKAVPGVPIAFENNHPDPYCGRWIRLAVEVREPKSGHWGAASVRLRLHDLDNL